MRGFLLGEMVVNQKTQDESNLKNRMKKLHQEEYLNGYKTEDLKFINQNLDWNLEHSLHYTKREKI